MTKPKPKTEAQKFVTEDRFNALENSVGKVADLLEKVLANQAIGPAPRPETKEEKEVAAAGPNKFQVNDEWEATARAIIGDAVDHTEVEHSKAGGIKFTVVIKNDKSNAHPDYIASAKADRRTKEVGQEGMEGVTEWCRLIKANLQRPH